MSKYIQIKMLLREKKKTKIKEIHLIKVENPINFHTSLCILINYL